VSKAKPGVNRQWTLERRPMGDIRDGDLVFGHGTIPKAEPGQVVVRNEWLSLDPTNRIWMADFHSYLPPVPLGAPMRGIVVGQVVDSGTDSLRPGQFVMGLGSWSDYSCELASNFSVVPELPGISRKDVFGTYSYSGTTAYFGLLDIAAPRIGETLVVSGSAGAVGCLVGQLGKAWGCKVVGIAGGADKCRWLTEELGFDASIDYKSEDLDQRLREICPEGVDIFFDNVGGPTLNTLLGRLNLFGRVVQCGMISTYNAEMTSEGPSNYPLILLHRLRVQGFLIFDSIARFPEAFRALRKLHLEGRLKWRYHEVEDLSLADPAVRLLYKGGNTGKMMVRVTDLSS